jgi:hypothetical protein
MNEPIDLACSMFKQARLTAAQQPLSCGVGARLTPPPHALAPLRRDNLYPSLYMLPLAPPGGAPGSYTLLQYSCAAGAVSSLSPTNQLTQASNAFASAVWLCLVPLLSQHTLCLAKRPARPRTAV